LSSLAIACVALACILAGTLLGMLVGRALPGHHLTGDSKDSVKQGLALIATLTALVLGMRVATTKGTYDTQSTAVRDLAANVVLLDRVLARYGPETKEARELLGGGVRALLEQMWPENCGQPANLTAADLRVAWEVCFDNVSALEPKTDAQRLLKPRALEITISLAQTRQRLLAQKETSIPLPFLLVLGFWLTILFGCFGLLAPRNLTVVVVLIVCMLSVSGALFLILEMDKPFDGILRISSAPLRNALSRLGE
jgi:hypothetical protein